MSRVRLTLSISFLFSNADQNAKLEPARARAVPRRPSVLPVGIRRARRCVFPGTTGWGSLGLPLVHKLLFRRWGCFASRMRSAHSAFSHLVVRHCHQRMYADFFPQPECTHANLQPLPPAVLSTYRGINAVAMGAGPAHALYFSSYEFLKKVLGNASGLQDTHFAVSGAHHTPFFFDCSVLRFSFLPHVCLWACR